MIKPPGTNVGGGINVGGTTGPTEVETTPPVGTGHGTADGVGGSTIAGGLAATAPTSKPGDVIKALAAKEPSGVKTVEMQSKPAKVTSVGVTYKFGGQGRKLEPNSQMLLEIPPQFRNRPVRFGVLKHRQDSSETTSPSGGDKWDPKPGSTSMQVHGQEMPEGKQWRYWKAPWGSSGSDGGKYAEHRGAGDPEVENMFDWIKHGHSAAGAGYGSSHEPLVVDAIKVKSVGEDPVRIHEITLQFLPAKPDSMDEHIFSPGTKFGDPWTGAGRAYGGGPKFQGKYPGALKLGGWSGGSGTPDLPAGWKMNGGALEVDLKAGQKFTTVEIACGDTHPDGKPNKDGHTGTLGYSRLSMGVKRAGSNSTDWFTESQGVPPEGVLFGGPTIENYVAQPGDKLVVRASSDATYVMGLRLWYNEQ